MTIPLKFYSAVVAKAISNAGIFAGCGFYKRSGGFALVANFLSSGTRTGGRMMVGACSRTRLPSNTSPCTHPVGPHVNVIDRPNCIYHNGYMSRHVASIRQQRCSQKHFQNIHEAEEVIMYTIHIYDTHIRTIHMIAHICLVHTTAHIRALIYVHSYTCTHIHALIYVHSYTCTHIRALLYVQVYLGAPCCSCAERS